MTDIQRYDIGTVLRFTITENDVPTDVSGVISIILKLRKPRTREVISRTMSFTTDGTDGKVEYTTVENDLDERGTYSAQVFLEFSSGSWHTERVKIHVSDNVD